MFRFILNTIAVILLLYCLACNGYKQVSYNNYKVYTVNGPEDKLFALRGSACETLNIRRNDHSEATATYLIAPDHEPGFVHSLTANGLYNYNVTVENLGRLIQEERRSLDARRADNGTNFHEVYHSYFEMLKFLIDIRLFVNKESGKRIAELKYLGSSYEMRKMVALRISTNHSAEKPIVFIEAGIHGREWMAPASVLYVIDQFVRNFTAHKDILDKVDFHIIPCSNPDGYEFSRLHDRMWRKTRSWNGKYWGVDGNRNFHFHWAGKGSSDNPASPTYRGPKPFSEPETRLIRDYGRWYKGRICAFLSVHAYGPYILYPWGYSAFETAPNADIMNKIGREASDVMKNLGQSDYLVGQASRLLYDASGGSDDYFMGVLGVPLSYTIELSELGQNSFIIHESNIIPIAHEFLEGLKIIAERAHGLFQKKESIKRIRFAGH